MAYFTVGMALHLEGSHEDVLGLMTDGLSWLRSDAEPVKVASESATFQARERLGAQLPKAPLERVARPLAAEGSAEAFLAGLHASPCRDRSRTRRGADGPGAARLGLIVVVVELLALRTLGFADQRGIFANARPLNPTALAQLAG